MIIRSADGESIVNFDNMSMIQIEEHEGKQRIVAYDVGRKTATPIGEYTTKAQAMDVVDAIEGGYLSTTAVLENGDIFNPAHGYVPVANVYHLPMDEGEDYVPYVEIPEED